MTDHESNVCPEHGSAHDIGTDYLRAFVDFYISDDVCKGCLAAAENELERRGVEVTLPRRITY